MKLGLFVPNLLSWSGDKPVIGGVERYAWNLISLIQELGWEVEVHQNGNQNWERELRGVKVIGHGVARFSTDAVVEEVNSRCQRVLYGSILQGPMYYKQESVVISHGVWWDGKEIDHREKQQMLAVCSDVLKQVNLVICCDYNFQNVMRAVAPGYTDRIRVVPNFVDTGKFRPAEGESIDKEEKRKKLSILYPRRLDDCRGISIFRSLATELLSSGENIEILLAVDENNPELNQQIEEFINREGVRCFNPGFEEMPAIYSRADIVVIPSIYSEGTSFSCLEAMACGKPVVATDVGGLTDIIIDGYNGVLVPPRLEPLRKGVFALLRSREKRDVLGRRARETVKAFSLQRWRQQWAGYLKKIYGPESD